MATLLHWLILFAFWLVLSGMFDAKHIVIGIIATVAVVLSDRDLERVSLGPAQSDSSHLALLHWRGVLPYSLWLLRAIAAANLQIARVVLDPKLPIEPAVVRVPTRVESDMEITLLANSVTATPGTITLQADEGRREFLIHALVDPQDVPSAVREIEDHVLRALRGSGEGA